MKCLFTVNVGDFITDQTRQLFRSACHRWQCDYAELSFPCCGGYPSTAKFWGPDKLCGYSTLFFVDGDTLISPAAPSPFDLCVADNVLYAVTDLQAGNPNDEWRKHVYRGPVQELLSRHPELSLHPEAKAFNSGVMMFRPTTLIRSVFQRARESFPVSWTKYQEQGFLNVFFHNTPGLTLQLLPEVWNHMVLSLSESISGNYINHFGGSAHAFLKR